MWKIPVRISKSLPQTKNGKKNDMTKAERPKSEATFPIR